MHYRFGYHFPHQGTFYSRRLFDRIGPYDVDAGYVADKVFAYRVIDECGRLEVGYLPEPVSVQVMGGISSASMFTPWKTFLRVAWPSGASLYAHPFRRAVLNAIYKCGMKWAFIGGETQRRYVDDARYVPRRSIAKPFAE
jgi:hypothetical protein